MNKIRLIYFMELDWCWIKQRPQFIAEELNKYYDITVVYKKKNRRKKLQKNNDTLLDLREFISIPLINRNQKLRRINDYRFNNLIKRIYRKLYPQVVYLTSPEQYSYVSLFPNCKIIYDCMDDHLAFCEDSGQVEEIANKERLLITKSDIILCSSINLEEKIVSRYPELVKDKIYIIRNGYSPFLNTIESRSHNKNGKFIISYFGTISKWFNFDYLIRSIEEIEDIEYHLYGPIDGISFPQNDRIIYEGIAEHHDIPKLAECADVLIMPFIVNELIESVDPVKLYEYIELNKNIICVEYNEIKRFDEFVYFYKDYNSFIEQLKYVNNNRELKYTESKRVFFLKDNTWEKRGEQIKSIIECFEERIL